VWLVILSDRGGVSTGLSAGRREAFVLLDCGDGIARDLVDRGAGAAHLRAVVITHDHVDHAAGLLALFHCLKLAGRAEDLVVFAPRAAPLVDGLCAVWAAGPGARAPFAVRRKTLVHDVPVQAGPFVLTTFPVRHRRSSSDPEGSLMEVHGLRLEAGGVRIVVSSDTGPCARLEQEATGADLAVIEATYADARPDRPDTHLSVAQAEDAGRRAKAFLLYHRT
jgi:ribonuclease BN (tRNA processing enzyme)